MADSFNLSNFFTITSWILISSAVQLVKPEGRPTKLQWVQFYPGNTKTFDHEKFEAGGAEMYDKLSKYYVASGNVPGGRIPGKYCVDLKTAFLAFKGTEYDQRSNMQLLAFPLGAVTWLPISPEDPIPPKSQMILGGVDPNQEDLYVCRFLIKWKGSQHLLPGKYMPSQGQKCFASLDRREHASTTFELLTKNMLGEALEVY